MISVGEALANRYFQATIRDLLGLLLTLAALGKFAGLKKFRTVLFSYDLFPIWAVFFLSYALPTIELVTGVALFFTLIPGVTGVLAASLFVCFGLVMVVNLLRGKSDLVCGCFGSKGIISWQTVARTLGLAGLALLATGQLGRVAMCFFVLFISLTVADLILRVRVPREENTTPGAA